ncbi:hypothetical protein TSST111916_16420 [Tsukamurella strandjordii]|uniref:hypothetical protein n=1 Tax=Tsukamurella sp. TY48 TaxID=2775495 RepID=UPI001C7D3859|nr:hypothetical protein [Tsukamurella sp. TY48]
MSAPTTAAAVSGAGAEAAVARAVAVSFAWFVVSAVVIVGCAFALPRLDDWSAQVGKAAVMVIFAVVVMVAGWSFWSNVQKLYRLLTTGTGS